MRAMDEKLDRLSFEKESVASEVPWKGDVLQVHPKDSLQPTKKKEVCLLFRGSGGLRIQRVQGGASLEEWYLGLHGRGWEVWMDTLPHSVEGTESWEGCCLAWVGWVARGGLQWQAEAWSGPRWRLVSGSAP